jgi:hypothetical protein
VVLRKKGVRIRLPAGIDDGSLFVVAAEETESHGIVFRLHIHVGGGRDR